MINTKDIKTLLEEASFFNSLPEHNLELLCGCGQLVHAKAGSFMLKEGEEANSLYLIRKGEVGIESHIPGGVLTVSKVGSDGVVGYSWLFPPYKNIFDARAITDVSAIKFDGRCLRAKAEADHELGYQFMKCFADILLKTMQSTRRQMLDIYGEVGKTS